MKTLRLKGENFTDSGKWPPWKMQVNNISLLLQTSLGGRAACRWCTAALFPQAQCSAPRWELKDFYSDCSSINSLSNFPWTFRQRGAWTELQCALPVTMVTGSRRAHLHQVTLDGWTLPLLPVSSRMQTWLLFTYDSARALSSPACFSFACCLLHASIGSCSCHSFPRQTVYCWDLCDSLWNVHVLAEPMSCQQSQWTSTKAGLCVWAGGESWLRRSPQHRRATLVWENVRKLLPGRAHGCSTLALSPGHQHPALRIAELRGGQGCSWAEFCLGSMSSKCMVRNSGA